MRNKYEDKYGVTRLRWRQGDPDSAISTTAIVEVWRTTLHAGGCTGDRPTVSVTARVEMWVGHAGAWHRVGYNGTLEPAYPQNQSGFDVRRWAPLPSRHWSGRVTLDGWDKEDPQP